MTEKGSQEFCIESQFEDQSSEEGSGGDYDDYEYSGVEEGSHDSYPNDETNPEYANSKYIESCQKGSKDSSIEIHYCAENLDSFFLDIRKCCERGLNINPKGESCTDHLAKAKEDKSGQGFISEVKSKFPFLESFGGDRTRLDDLTIYRMKKEYLSVTVHDFNLTKTSHGLVLNYNDR
jgi:hypothetical protein